MKHSSLKRLKASTRRPSHTAIISTQNASDTDRERSADTKAAALLTGSRSLRGGAKLLPALPPPTGGVELPHPGCSRPETHTGSAGGSPSWPGPLPPHPSWSPPTGRHFRSAGADGPSGVKVGAGAPGTVLALPALPGRTPQRRSGAATASGTRATVAASKAFSDARAVRGEGGAARGAALRTAPPPAIRAAGGPRRGTAGRCCGWAHARRVGGRAGTCGAARHRGNANCKKPVTPCEFLELGDITEQYTMSTAGVAAQEMRVPLKTGFLHTNQGMGGLKTCWGSHSGFENTFFNMDPIAVAYNLNPSAEQHLPSIGHSSNCVSTNEHSFAESCMQVPSQKSSPAPVSPKNEQPISRCEDQLIPGFSKLSLTTGCVSEETPPHMPIKSGPIQFLSASSHDRSSRPLPPLPVPEDITPDEVDREVEFLTSSDTDFLLEDYGLPPFKSSGSSRRSFRGCGQINYAYFDAPTGPKPEDANPTQSLNGCISSIYPPPQQLHRRLRRSHSGPAGSLNKPVARLSGHLNRSSPNSDEDKPEIPPRVPIPPRALKPDYRRWSAEVASSAYSDEDRPPKVPPREPLSRSNSRTPSPKSLPSYLNGVMPPTQSFAPDPKYVSNKALQRQNSEGSSNRVPCILPIIENGKKASSTHYYLLPERPPYLDKYEKFFREAEETSSNTEVQSWSGDCMATSVPTRLDSKPRMDITGHLKRKHLSYVVSP